VASPCWHCIIHLAESGESGHTSGEAAPTRRTHVASVATLSAGRFRRTLRCVATRDRPKKSDGRPCDRRAGMACKDHGPPGSLSSTTRRMSQPRPTPFERADRSLSQPNAASSPVLPGSTPELRPTQPPPVRGVGCSHLGSQNRQGINETDEFCADAQTDGSREQGRGRSRCAKAEPQSLGGVS
jgi:hypothetical protein